MLWNVKIYVNTYVPTELKTMKILFSIMSNLQIH